MYQILALVCGVVVGVMLTLNGELTAQLGTYPAAAVIHAVGTLAALAACGCQREKPALWGRRPRWLYLGGAIGVFTTVANLVAYGKISMTSIVALGLFGKTIASLLVDHFGLMGMEKRPFQKASLWTLLFAAAGIAVMLDSPMSGAFFPVMISIAAGVSDVICRSVNARLSDQIGPLRGSLVNHAVGLAVTVVLAAAAFFRDGLPALTAGAFRPWIYFGGVLGVILILLNNLIVPHLPAFQFTMLTFIAEIFTGVLIDITIGAGHLDASFAGGLLVAAGVAVTTVMERLRSKKAAGA